ncbi:MAG: 6-phosphogluconolactonase [Candidatus Auribacterota bacterium]|jgi:6-phosphogluconolactonase
MYSSVCKYTSKEEMSKAAAESIANLICRIAREQVFVTLVLSGGNSPNGIYSLLAKEPLVSKIPWEIVYIFWGDERCVPADHPENNYKNAYEAMIKHIPIPARNVCRVKTEGFTPDQVAEDYEKKIHLCFDRHGIHTDIPVFDIILLGVGPDGHTASLFSGSPALDETGKAVVSVDAPPTYTIINRVTMTLPVLNAARHVYFVVAGTDKEPVVSKILSCPAYIRSIYPAARVISPPDIQWFIA